MRITFDGAKSEKTLQERKLNFRRVVEVFAAVHRTRVDERRDYGEERFITAGRLDGRIVVVVGTPRGRARRVISMWKANAREVKALAPYLEGSR